MATQANQTVHSGNTVLLKVNGAIVGRAQSLDGRRSFGTEGVYEIGSIMPQEHVNNRYEGTVQLERFLIKTADLAKVGMAALGEEILTKDIIDIEVIDKATGNTVRVYRGCTAVDYSENFRVGAISGENASFQYLSCDRGNTDGISELLGEVSSDAQTYLQTMGNRTATTSASQVSGVSGYLEGTNAAQRANTNDVGKGTDVTLTV